MAYDYYFKSGVATYTPCPVPREPAGGTLGDYDKYGAADPNGVVGHIRRSNEGLSYDSGLYILPSPATPLPAHTPPTASFEMFFGFHPSCGSVSGLLSVWFRVKAVRTSRCDNVLQYANLYTFIAYEASLYVNADYMHTEGTLMSNDTGAEVVNGVTHHRVSVDEGFVTLWQSRNVTTIHPANAWLMRKSSDTAEPLVVLDSWGYSVT